MALAEVALAEVALAEAEISPQSSGKPTDIGDGLRLSPPIDSALVMVIQPHCALDIMQITVPLQSLHIVLYTYFQELRTL